MRALRKVSFPLLVCLVAGVAIACGGTGSETSDASDGPSATPAGEAAARPAHEAGRSAVAEVAAAAADDPFGTPLESPERYYGVYANPAKPDRKWFVTEAKRSPMAEQAPEVPPGHLAIGAMFGDVAPWHMKTLSETTFEQAYVNSFQPEPTAVEFELRADGRAVAMTFTNSQMASEGRLERVGDLPEGW